MMTVAQLIEALKKYPEHYNVTIARFDSQYVEDVSLGRDGSQAVVVIEHRKV